ncbi:MAG: hypothetical protein JXA78_13045 [Anaerolineales bacterium]|nr:hypothetical protein [Anaerolineales bacterium]
MARGIFSYALIACLLLLLAGSCRQVEPQERPYLHTVWVPTPTVPIISPSPDSVYPQPLAVQPPLAGSYPYPGVIPSAEAPPPPYPPPTEPLGPRPASIITATIKTLPETGQGISAYDFVDEMHGWVATGMGWEEGAPGALFATQDGGETWELLSRDNGNIIRQLNFVSPTQGWRIVNGELEATQDGGQQWNPLDTAWEGDSAYQMQLLDADQGWVLTRKSGLFWTRDGGLTWALSPAPEHDQDFHPSEDTPLYFLDEVHGWAVFTTRASGVGFWELRETRDGGLSWQTILQAQPEICVSGAFPCIPQQLVFLDRQYGWLTGDHQLFATQDGGRTWQKIAGDYLDPRLWLPDLLSQEIGYVLASGGNGWYSDHALLKTTDGGQSWGQIYPGLFPLRDIQFFDDQEGIGIGLVNENGAVLKTVDGGLSWQVIASLGPQILGGASSLSFADREHGWILAYDKLDCNPPPYTSDCIKTWLYRTSDGGSSWQRFRELKSLGGGGGSLSFVDARSGYYRTHEGQLYVTQDGGQTFDRCPNAPDGLRDIQFANTRTGWGISGRAIYVTTNGCDTWRQAPIGFALWQPILINPIHYLSYLPGGVAWTLGVDYSLGNSLTKRYPYFWVVFNTQDNGRTWTGIIPGRVTVSDMRFSDPLNGWMRGGEHPLARGGCLYGVDHLYITHDGGLTWQQVR